MDLLEFVITTNNYQPDQNINHFKGVTVIQSRCICTPKHGMKWIHSHISKFNGDTDNITLGGGSAGARSVMNHMTHSDSYDYFNNALTIGPAAIPYWKTSEVDEIFTRIYGHIRRVSN